MSGEGEGVIRRRWSVKFAWYDAWIGAFWDRHEHILYICPLPCVVIETWKQVEYDFNFIFAEPYTP
jgi:hypothetical protein